MGLNQHPFQITSGSIFKIFKSPTNRFVTLQCEMDQPAFGFVRQGRTQGFEHDGIAEPPGCGNGLIGVGGDGLLNNRNTIFAEQFFGLMFVEKCPVSGFDGCAEIHKHSFFLGERRSLIRK